eukprot:7389466-Prymnesium_polylepis.1
MTVTKPAGPGTSGGNGGSRGGPGGDGGAIGGSVQPEPGIAYAERQVLAHILASGSSRPTGDEKEKKHPAAVTRATYSLTLARQVATMSQSNRAAAMLCMPAAQSADCTQRTCASNAPVISMHPPLSPPSTAPSMIEVRVVLLAFAPVLAFAATSSAICRK